MQLATRGWEDEDRDEVVRGSRPGLLRTLPVDVEQDVAPLGERLLYRVARRPVGVAVHLGVLQKLTAVAHAAELGHAHEMVVHVVDLAPPPRTRRHGDGERERLVLLQQEARQRALARA